VYSHFVLETNSHISYNFFLYKVLKIKVKRLKSSIKKKKNFVEFNAQTVFTYLLPCPPVNGFVSCAEKS